MDNANPRLNSFLTLLSFPRQRKRTPSTKSEKACLYSKENEQFTLFLFDFAHYLAFFHVLRNQLLIVTDLLLNHVN